MRDKAALAPGHRRLLYLVFALLWLTGAGWLYLRYIREIEGGAASAVLMKIHGAAAMAFLILFGTLLWGHVPAGWAQRRQRPSGIALTGSAILLIWTGWSLYYSGETLRRVSSLSHGMIGIAFPAFLGVHLLGARITRKVRKILS